MITTKQIAREQTVMKVVDAYEICTCDVCNKRIYIKSNIKLKENKKHVRYFHVETDMIDGTDDERFICEDCMRKEYLAFRKSCLKNDRMLKIECIHSWSMENLDISFIIHIDSIEVVPNELEDEETIVLQGNTYKLNDLEDMEPPEVRFPTKASEAEMLDAIREQSIRRAEMNSDTDRIREKFCENDLIQKKLHHLEENSLYGLSGEYSKNETC